MKVTIDRDELEGMRTAFCKILSFATVAEADNALTDRERLDVIRVLARERVIGGRVAGALRRHVDRVREILEGVGRGN